jgi:hypothetical protein
LCALSYRAEHPARLGKDHAVNDFEMTPADARDAALARLAYALNEEAQREYTQDRTDRIDRLAHAVLLANANRA